MSSLYFFSILLPSLKPRYAFTRTRLHLSRAATAHQSLDNQLKVKPSIWGQPGQSVRVFLEDMSGREELRRKKAELCRSGFQKLEEQQNNTEDVLLAQP